MLGFRLIIEMTCVLIKLKHLMFKPGMFKPTFNIL